ncbi:transposase [Nocardia sp. NPDC047654]|uniref:transposase n=1 Tax=Nocardia sp. NPDC047654 TaxID=3364314 RepID=UPI00372218CE
MLKTIYAYGLRRTEINDTWPLADVQQCVVDLVRASLKYTSRKCWSRITTELRAIYTAPTVEAANYCSTSSSRNGNRNTRR